MKENYHYCCTTPYFYKALRNLGVIHKRRPQGGVRGVKGKGKRDTCGHRGEGKSSKGGRPQKNFEESQ